MSEVRTLLHRPISTEDGDLRLGEHVCFASALLLLVLGFFGVGKLSETLADVLVGTLATLGVALELVILGMLLPLRSRGETR